MAFGDDLERFRQKVDRNTRRLHNGCADQAFASVLEGSDLTGAPGQPIDTGYLRGSWQNIIEGPLVRFIATRCAYAPVIETGLRQAYDPAGTVGEDDPEFTHRKSTVGGHQSVALTRAAWPRIVDWVNQQITAGGR